MKNILKWSWGKTRKNLQVETCQSITAYLFYVREGWAIASCVHIWEFSFFLKICSILQMLMFIFSIWGPLAILKLDIWLNALNHFRMLHLFFYPGVNTWIGLALVQKFRTYRAVNFKNIWAFLYACICACVNCWVSSIIWVWWKKSYLNCDEGVYWPRQISSL